jgi:hypothetical protein
VEVQVLSRAFFSKCVTEQLAEKMEGTQELLVCGQVEAELLPRLRAKIQERIAAGDFTEDELHYVSKVNLELVNTALEVDEKTLEKLRQACQLWDIQFRPLNITSHRPVIGPIIVGLKKLCFPIVRLFMKDVIERQRLFNASVISLLARIANQKKID